MTILAGSLAGMVRLWLWPDRIGEIANEVLPREASWRTAVIFTAYAVAMIHLLILLGLTVLGTPRAYRAHRKFFWLFFTVVLYATLTSNAVGNDRYRMQAMPVVFPMAGIGYDALLRRRAASTQQESSHS
jgi:Na+/H+ antiporter NhaD/arsenite permease-like protein